MEELYAIHTVFIDKENILFLEQWIDYHLVLGFDRFYLYNNSKVTRTGGAHANHQCFKARNTNKYGINYDKILNLSNNEVVNLLNKIVDKYKDHVYLIEWSPQNKDGEILHNQEDAHNHCLEKLKKDNIKWCANIDMDEYIVLKEDNIKKYISKLDDDVFTLQMGQFLYDSRFNNLNELIVNISKQCLTNWQNNTYSAHKHIYKVSNTEKLKVHWAIGKGKLIRPALNEIWFNHYKVKDSDSCKKNINKINEKIREQVNINSKNYIKIKPNDYLD